MIQKYSFIFDGNTSCVIFSFFPIVSIFLLSPTSFHFSQFLSIFYGRITISHKYKLHAVRWTQYFFRVSILPQFQYYLTHKKRWIRNWGLIVRYTIYIHIFCVLIFCNINYGKWHYMPQIKWNINNYYTRTRTKTILTIDL